MSLPISKTKSLLNANKWVLRIALTICCVLGIFVIYRVLRPSFCLETGQLPTGPVYPNSVLVLRDPNLSYWPYATDYYFSTDDGDRIIDYYQRIAGCYGIESDITCVGKSTPTGEFTVYIKRFLLPPSNEEISYRIYYNWDSCDVPLLK